MNITQDRLAELKPIGTSRAGGNFGIVKRFDDDAIKIFKDSEFIEKYHLEVELKKINKVKIDGVALPKELVYMDGKFVGYTMPYFRGFNLSIIFMKIERGMLKASEEEINRLYNNLIMKVKELSKQHIKMVDVKPDNIIYYNGELCIIDCDFYRYTEMKNLEEYNISLVDAAIKKHMGKLFNISLYQDDKVLRFNDNIKSN